MSGPQQRPGVFESVHPHHPREKHAYRDRSVPGCPELDLDLDLRVSDLPDQAESFGQGTYTSPSSYAIGTRCPSVADGLRPLRGSSERGGAGTAPLFRTDGDEETHTWRRSPKPIRRLQHSRYGSPCSSAWRAGRAAPHSRASTPPIRCRGATARLRSLLGQAVRVASSSWRTVWTV
ncbi:SCO0268 family class II lanthipeptide [Streptomyces thermocarboxydus]